MLEHHIIITSIMLKYRCVPIGTSVLCLKHTHYQKKNVSPSLQKCMRVNIPTGKLHIFILFLVHLYVQVAFPRINQNLFFLTL